MYTIPDFEFDHTTHALSGPLEILTGIIHFVFY